MKKNTNQLLIQIRQQYQEKRAKKKYKQRKKRAKQQWRHQPATKFIPKNTDIIPIISPKNLCLIDNTDQVLKYISSAKEVLKTKNPILLDISKIENLSQETIPFLLSHIKDKNFNQEVRIYGTEPDNDTYNEIFRASGFYKFVRTNKKVKENEKSIMHEESNVKVKPSLAADVVELISNSEKFEEADTEPLYNILIELMSNTHHHADLKKYGSSKWWLYITDNHINNKKCVTFLDLGVGIFESIIVRNYVSKVRRNVFDNTHLVNDLLSGKIGSRIDIDNSIRGKGIPQIFEYSQLDCFEKFFLITNDVKIDLKTRKAVKLSENLSGTFYYFQMKY